MGTRMIWGIREPSHRLGYDPSRRAGARRSAVSRARQWAPVLLCLLARVGAAGAWACTISEPATAIAGATGSTDEAGSGTSAAASTGGAGGSVVPMASPSPAPRAPATDCGQTQCVAPANIAGDLLRSATGLAIIVPDAFACCVDETQGMCGSAAELGGMCDTPAIAETSCTGIDLSSLAALVGGLGANGKSAMIGCCTHGACGLDGALFGRGCVENADAKRMLSAVPLIGALICVPPPAACTGAGAATEHDADAGL
jgi:hypothetical protein